MTDFMVRESGDDGIFVSVAQTEAIYQCVDGHFCPYRGGMGRGKLSVILSVGNDI